MFISKVEKFFKVKEKGSTVKRELMAGLVTFLAMAYILAVNPNMLADAGMDWGSVFLATAIAAGVTTIFMGLYAKYPVALAPGMGLNAFFAYTVCAPWAFAKSWQFGLATVIVSGVLFLIIAMTGLRKTIINAIPQELKYAVGAGIGLFIAFIGLKNAGIIFIDLGAGLPALGDFGPVMLVGLFGLFLTVVLMVRKVKGALFFGIIGTVVVGLIVNYAFLGGAGPIDLPSWNGFQLDIGFSTFGGAFSEIGNVVTSLDGWVIILGFLFVDFFDTAGTLMAVAEPAGIANEKGELVDGEKALVVDAAGTILGGILGTSTITSYVESATGIEAGGRTGLTAVTTGVLFLLAIILFPVLNVVTGVATGPVLVVVGVLMAGAMKRIDWADFEVAVPAFLTMVVMVLSYSISNGIAVGFFSYVVVKLAAGKRKEIHPVMYGLAIFFALYFTITTLV